MDQLDATIHLAFAFDIGYEIDLDRARAMIPGESGLLARRRLPPPVLESLIPVADTPREVDTGEMSQAARGSIP